jgi:hypothetical protein
VGQEFSKSTEVVDSDEPQNHQQFLERIQEINRNIERIYDEMEIDEKQIIKIEGSKKDQIKRLEGYYRELYKKGAFVESKTMRQKSLNEVCRTIMEEMDRRDFTAYSKKTVWHVLSDDCKRAWRKPDTINGKLPCGSLLDVETQSIYDEYMDHINELLDFDYNELPKSLQMGIAEHFYKTYRYHDKEWQKHDITVVKHQDGLNIPNPFAGIIRVEEGVPYEGELFECLKNLKKSINDAMKKMRLDMKDAKGNRVITLEREHELAMGVRTLEGYFLPWKNYKWKRDIPGWAHLILKRLELKSKSGASKWSRKKVDQRFLDGLAGIEDLERGLTREEINKIQKRMVRFFLQFIMHHEGLMALSEAFVEITEQKRAAHSIKMNPKLSDSA